MNEPMLNRAFENRSFPKASDGNARSLSARDNDPLAELARLVGQDDPFRDIFGDAKRAAGQREPVVADDTTWLEAALRPGHPAHHQELHLQPEPEPAFGYEEPQSDAYAEDEHELGPDITLQKRRGGLALAAILSVAVIGGIGLLAFRDDLSGNAAGTPPVIRAEPGPNKTIPEKDDTADARQHAKLIYDRVGSVEPNGSAKVVPRSEEPVELPPAETRGTIAPDAPAPAGQASSTAQPGPSEPRRVRTVLIKPDGSATDTADATASPGTTASAAPSFDRPTGYPFSIIDEEPGAAGSSAQTPAFAATPPAASNAPVPLPPARPPSTTMVRSASIAPAEPPPQRSVAPAPARPAAPQAAAPAPARPAPQATAPTRVANAPANAVPVSNGGGRFAVQLTSQKSEQEAREAYSGLQRRFGSVLGSYPPSIQKADLGSRGIFYRVRVGTNSREDAVRLCATLKSQGGDCVVQAN